MLIKIQQMQQYADIYVQQSHSTYFGCHSTHHQVYLNCNRSLQYRSQYRYSYFPTAWPDRDWFVRVAHTIHMTCIGGRGYSF